MSDIEIPPRRTRCIAERVEVCGAAREATSGLREPLASAISSMSNPCCDPRIVASLRPLRWTPVSNHNKSSEEHGVR